MKKVSIRHNSETILTGRTPSGATLYFLPHVDTPVDSEEIADAVIYDNNAQSVFKMEKVVEDVPDPE